MYDLACLTCPSCARAWPQELSHWFCSQNLWLSSGIAYRSDCQMTGRGLNLDSILNSASWSRFYLLWSPKINCVDFEFFLSPFKTPKLRAVLRLYQPSSPGLCSGLISVKSSRGKHVCSDLNQIGSKWNAMFGQDKFQFFIFSAICLCKQSCTVLLTNHNLILQIVLNFKVPLRTGSSDFSEVDELLNENWAKIVHGGNISTPIYVMQ